MACHTTILRDRFFKVPEQLFIFHWITHVFIFLKPEWPPILIINFAVLIQTKQ